MEKTSSEGDLYLYKDLIQENDGTKNQWGKGWNVWKYWENRLFILKDIRKNCYLISYIKVESGVL